MNREKSAKFDMFAVLLLLCVFALALLSLLLSGAKSYSGLTKAGYAAQDRQTAALYISNRVFQAERSSDIVIEEKSGVQCIGVPEDVEGEEYLTRVYLYEGWIMELFEAKDADFIPESGEKIFKAESLSFRREGDVIWADLTAEGETVHLPYALKGGKR